MADEKPPCEGCSKKEAAALQAVVTAEQMRSQAEQARVAAESQVAVLRQQIEVIEANRRNEAAHLKLALDKQQLEYEAARKVQAERSEARDELLRSAKQETQVARGERMEILRLQGAVQERALQAADRERVLQQHIQHLNTRLLASGQGLTDPTCAHCGDADPETRLFTIGLIHRIPGEETHWPAAKVAMCPDCAQTVMEEVRTLVNGHMADKDKRLALKAAFVERAKAEAAAAAEAKVDPKKDAEPRDA